MARIKLITNPAAPTSFNAHYMQDMFAQWFDIVAYDPAATYDPTCSAAMVQGLGTDTEWFKPLQAQGMAVIIESLWESHYFGPIEGTMILTNPNWFWYNESLWYDFLGYSGYRPQKTYTKLAFMPMRLAKRYRDRLYELFAPLLDQMIYSYVERGILLPDDLPPDLKDPASLFQRNFNPAWYDSTYFSIVAETLFNDSGVFLTEKTFKPMAFEHPFMICGQWKHLARLQELGFVTWDNLFDESYDAITSGPDRMAAIYKNACDFVPEPYSAETIQRLAHNRNHFYNRGLVESRIFSELVEPILNHVHD